MAEVKVLDEVEVTEEMVNGCEVVESKGKRLWKKVKKPVLIAGAVVTALGIGTILGKRKASSEEELLDAEEIDDETYQQLVNEELV